jgi:hypothetical protein
MKPLRSEIEEYTVDAVSMAAALATTIIALYYKITLSLLVSTSWEALFITMCALTSLSLFNIERWRLPAILILLVAAFPTPKYEIAHYVFAITFFLISYIKILTAKRYNWWALTLIFGIGILLQDKFSYQSLLYFEAIAVPTIIGHHTCYLIHRVRTAVKRKRATTSLK